MRRISGPANYLREEENQHDYDPHYEGNKCIDPINQSSWLSMRSSLGLEDGLRDFPRDLIPYSINDILKGLSDLRVTRMVAFVLSVVHTSSGIWTLTLTDHSTAKIEGFTTPKAVEQFPSLLIPGTSFLAENVAIFISSPTTQRILNIHDRCINAVYSSKNYLQPELSANEHSFHNDDDSDNDEN